MEHNRDRQTTTICLHMSEAVDSINRKEIKCPFMSTLSKIYCRNLNCSYAVSIAVCETVLGLWVVIVLSTKHGT